MSPDSFGPSLKDMARLSAWSEMAASSDGTWSMVIHECTSVHICTLENNHKVKALYSVWVLNDFIHEQWLLIQSLSDERHFQLGQTDALQLFPLILIEDPCCFKPEDLVIVERIYK